MLVADGRFKLMLFYFMESLEVYDLIYNTFYIYHFTDRIVADLTKKEFHYPVGLDV